jgi:branched-chain amino acid transport system substrate-binding protein
MTAVRIVGKTLLRCILLLCVSSAHAQDIRIAVAGSMTGSLAEAGDEVKRGAELAAKDINAAGGVNGRKIVLSIEDDACDPKQAVSVANHVVGEQITLVDGHVCSGASIPASEVYAEYDVLMMTPASVNSKLTDNAFAKGWPTIMRLYARDDNQGRMVGAWMADKYKNKKIAFVHDKSTYGKNLADQVKANLNAAGVQEILYEGINPGEKDYSAIVSKLKAVGAEVVYYGGYPTEGGIILRQAADQGVKFQMVTTSGFVSPEFWSIAGSAGEGTLFPFPRNPMGLAPPNMSSRSFGRPATSQQGLRCLATPRCRRLRKAFGAQARWTAGPLRVRFARAIPSKRCSARWPSTQRGTPKA